MKCGDAECLMTLQDVALLPLYLIWYEPHIENNYGTVCVEIELESNYYNCSNLAGILPRLLCFPAGSQETRFYTTTFNFLCRVKSPFSLHCGCWRGRIFIVALRLYFSSRLGYMVHPERFLSNSSFLCLFLLGLNPVPIAESWGFLSPNAIPRLI